MNRYLESNSDSELLLNVLADEVHRAHQRCLQTLGCDPTKQRVSLLPMNIIHTSFTTLLPHFSFFKHCHPFYGQVNFLFEAGSFVMRLVKGAYSCISLVAGVGMVAFRDPFGIR